MTKIVYYSIEKLILLFDLTGFLSNNSISIRSYYKKE